MKRDSRDTLSRAEREWLDGLLGAEGSAKSVPRETEIGGQHHLLAYITPEEAAVLRRRRGGIDRDGSQVYGPQRVPAFRDESAGNGGEGDAGDDSAGSPAGDGGGVMGGADVGGFGDGFGGPGGFGRGDPDDASHAGGRPGGGVPSSDVGLGGGFGSSPTGIGSVDRAIDARNRAMAGQYGQMAQAAAIGSMFGATPAVGIGLASALGQGIGSITGAITEGLGGTPGTNSDVGDPSDGMTPADMAANPQSALALKPAAQQSPLQIARRGTRGYWE